MIKSILLYTLVFFTIFFVSFFLHDNYIQNQHIILPFSLKKVYLFHLGFSLLICTNFLLFSIVDKIFEQLGFIYLATIVLKIVLLCIVFYNPIFTKDDLSFNSRIALFIPAIIFLLTEAIFVAKILMKKQ
ncbi:DUF6168 family protein [Polaribacter sp. R77954]|uniref:DUF6168 family protein n=1 Tax=Polaribacter sp. R77954 TaxID=3093870 RepID=UPI0037C554DE